MTEVPEGQSRRKRDDCGSAVLGAWASGALAMLKLCKEGQSTADLEASARYALTISVRP
jgi:hypothetical protein